MNEDRPRLFRANGSWVMVLIAHIDLEFVMIDISPNTGRVYVGLTPIFERWLAEHDPHARVVTCGDSVIVTFVDEYAAMLFRMSYDVTVVRSE